ncbi:amidohydrolase [Candidatus Chloroploca sp. Khr17]|uniref:amidohydrolase n=1 Tax=Candidatus Chloroploca sp. Khr17 TaxID=2496869 RepID=UPI00101D4AFB|nr:amidohydrolase [Candidatus Chloroploca sp. Khr17]
MTTLILYNGPIYTLDPALPVAQALAVRDGRVVALGTERQVQEIVAIAGGTHELIDLAGRAVVPGLTDAHVHITWQGFTRREANLAGVATLEMALEMVAQRDARLPQVAWLRGSGWDHVLWGGRWPTRDDLDRVCLHRPVILLRKDGHSAWVNRRALELAGITAATPDPAGGQIMRDNDGEPTGILVDTAMDLVRAVEPRLSEQDRLGALQAAFDEALSYGITSIHVPPGTDPADASTTLRDLQTMRQRGWLSVRCLVYMAQPDLDAAIALGLRSGFGDAWLRLGGLKLFADGSLGSQSAEMLRPYEGTSSTGLAMMPPEVLEATIRRANAHGISVAVHAIGDAANRKVLDAIERALHDRQAQPEAFPSLALPNRIEHVQVLHPADIPRLGQLGIIASMQPIHCTSDITAASQLWGGERCRSAYAWRSVQASGATLAFGSDAPVETMNPWSGIHAAVTRQRPDGTPVDGWYAEQCLTVEEALRAYCYGPAVASAETAVKGTLTPGKLADLVVLTGDPLQCRADELGAITAAMTLVDGQVVFERSSSGG